MPGLHLLQEIPEENVANTRDFFTVCVSMYAL